MAREGSPIVHLLTMLSQTLGGTDFYFHYCNGMCMPRNVINTQHMQVIQADVNGKNLSL